MPGIKFTHHGDFKKTKDFLKKVSMLDPRDKLEKYGKMGVEALRSATPVDSGRTADAWYYKVEKKLGSISISWYNSNVNQGVPIAIILNYGHGTGWGGYVMGREYISPAIQPIFDEIEEGIWKEVQDS